MRKRIRRHYLRSSTNKNGMNTDDQVRKIAIGADHGAFDTKEMLKSFLELAGYKVVDVGTFNSSVKVD